MNFQLPRGALRWVILLWLVTSVFFTCLSIAAANLTTLALPLLTLIMAMGICAGIRFCAWAMLAVWALRLVLIPLDMFVFSEGPVAWRSLIILTVLHLWFIYALYRWLYHDYYRTPEFYDADDERIED